MADDAVTMTQDVLNMTQDQIPGDLPAVASAIPPDTLPPPFIANTVQAGDTTLPPEVIYQYQAILNLASYTYRI